MSISNKLGVATNPTEMRLIARITAVLLTLPLLLKLFNINRIVTMLTPEPPREPRRQLSRERVAYLCIRVLTLFGKLSYRSSCLRRCLLLFHCLRVYGTPAVIHFGVKTRTEELLGHCWLTIDGSLYHDRIDMVSQFTHMFALPRSMPSFSSPDHENKTLDLEGVSFDA